MDFEVIEINLSIEERNQEYADIYEKHGSDGDDLCTMWSSHLMRIASTTEFAGLHALWKPSKTSCFEYNLNFSNSYLATVNRVDYSTLSADIEIIDTKKSKRIDLPREMSVSLVELYVTREQDNDNTSLIDNIALCLDQMRTFYKYLWWSWDMDYPNLKLWFSKVLPYRLKLYEDLTLGNYSESITKKIKTLIEKGKFFHGLYLKETESINQDDEPNMEMERNIVKYVKNVELVKESLELLTKKSRLSSSSRRGDKQDKLNSSGGFLVVNGLNVRKMVNYTSEIAKLYPSIKIKQVSNKPENALSSYECNDMIFLSPGEHSLTAECLNTNVTIRGSTLEETITRGESFFWYLLKTTSDNINLHNLTIRSGENSVLIYVKEGITCLDSVTMISSTERQKAIIVEQRAILMANRCQFDDFDTAIVCLPGSAVQLTNCVFKRNSVAIEVIGEVQLSLNNVTATQSGKAFIRYEGDAQSNECRSLEEFSNVADVSMESVEVDDAESAVQFV